VLRIYTARHRVTNCNVQNVLLVVLQQDKCLKSNINSDDNIYTADTIVRVHSVHTMKSSCQLLDQANRFGLCHHLD